MKSAIIALALAVSVNANADTNTKDRLCLEYGKMGELVSELYASGTSIKRAYQIVEVHGGENVREYKQILDYIYTMDLKPKDARKIIYLKCRTGSYD